jgi:Kelch motif protein
MTGSLNTGRYSHTATLLPNGKVLVAGGSNFGGQSLASAELYDPATGTWSATDSLRARAGHKAALLQNGKVLVVGGYDTSTETFLATADLYDPATGTWSATGSLNIGRDLLLQQLQVPPRQPRQP